MKQTRSSREAAPKVEVKKGGSLGRVGLIAVFGFALGLIWPRLAGISLVPEAPLEHPSSPAAASVKNAAVMGS